jgi:hypothetical protein
MKWVAVFLAVLALTSCSASDDERHEYLRDNGLVAWDEFGEEDPESFAYLTYEGQQICADMEKYGYDVESMILRETADTDPALWPTVELLIRGADKYLC